MPYITIEGIRFLIRGNYTATEVRARYAAFLKKFPTTTLTLRQWANRGAIYKRMDRSKPCSSTKT